jgi:hypothetical protein
MLDRFTIHHAAALALVGCYLMTPPLNDAGLPDTDAPITSWHNEMSFNSAHDCEEGKITLPVKKIEGLKRIEKDQAKIPKGNPQLFDQYSSWTRRALAVAKCIGTDDPRLKGN